MSIVCTLPDEADGVAQDDGKGYKRRGRDIEQRVVQDERFTTGKEFAPRQAVPQEYEQGGGAAKQDEREVVHGRIGSDELEAGDTLFVRLRGRDSIG